MDLHHEQAITHGTTRYPLASATPLTGDFTELSSVHLGDHSEPASNGVLSKGPVAPRRGSGTFGKRRDITQKFTAAAEALATGQLVKDEFFTLFEAVGALEIGDPKMDSGYLGPGDTLEDDYDVLRELLPDEVVGIMDQLLCTEVAWYMGNHLPQTLFSSIYIDKLLWPEPKTFDQASFKRSAPPSQENPMVHIVFRAYCLSLIKTCDFVHKKIVRETYYEEEDFVSNLYNRKLFSDLDIGQFNSFLDEAIQFVHDDKSLTVELRKAILCRLAFRKEFLEVVSHEQDPIQRDDVWSWKPCLDLLEKLFESKGIGKPVPAAFSTKIQRRLASSVPPRPLVTVNISEAYEYLKRLFEDGKATMPLLDCERGSQMITFVLVFQTRKPQPSTYIRCLLASLIYDEMRFTEKTEFTQFIFEDLAEIVLPAHELVDMANFDVEPPHDTRFKLARLMEKFVTRAGQLYLDMIRASTMNRSRIRRMLCHTIWDWETFQLDSEELDVELRQLTHEEPLRSSTEPGAEELYSFPLSSWAYYHKLRQMEWIVQLGFELQIYQDGEMAGMYWYLHHLANTRLLHLQRIRTFTSRRFAQNVKPTMKEHKAFSRSFSFLGFAMLEASATQSLSDALSCLYIAMTHLNLIPTTLPPYSTPELRYTLRMKPFNSVSVPAVPSYEEYITSINPFLNLSTTPSPAIDRLKMERLNTLLDSADLAAKIARKEWETVTKASVEAARCNGCEKEWRAGQKDVLRSVIALSIAVAMVKKWVAEGRKEGGLKVEIRGKGYHDWWVVPRIKAI